MPASRNQRSNSAIGSGSTSSSLSGLSVSITRTVWRRLAPRLVPDEALLRAVVHPGRGHPLAVVLDPLRALAAAGRAPLGRDVQLGHGRTSLGLGLTGLGRSIPGYRDVRT